MTGNSSDLVFVDAEITTVGKGSTIVSLRLRLRVNALSFSRQDVIDLVEIQIFEDKTSHSSVLMQRLPTIKTIVVVEADPCRSRNPCKNNGKCYKRMEGVSELSCSCVKGTSGAMCETVLSACVPNPCQNNGTCELTNNGGFNCTCPDGFGGYKCEQELTACSENPCFNNGTCEVTENDGFNCTCPDGVTGESCEYDINECFTTYPCQNGGTCKDSVGGFTCVCLPGYAGVGCEEVDDACAEPTCQNNATCEDFVTYHTCNCSDGFYGASCNETSLLCRPGFCLNGGTCFNRGLTEFFCSCPEAWDGPYCDRSADDCANVNCNGRGRCIDLEADYQCSCEDGFGGRDCEIDYDECEVFNMCQNGGECVDGPGLENMTCVCKKGFSGANCSEEIDQCLQLIEPCENNGTCRTRSATFFCECPLGYEGKTCEKVFDPCDDEPCISGRCQIKEQVDFTCLCDENSEGELCDINVQQLSLEVVFRVIPPGIELSIINAVLDLQLDHKIQNISASSDSPLMFTVNYTYRASAMDYQPAQDWELIFSHRYFNSSGTSLITKFDAEVDECESQPCKNGGTCTDLKDSFNCSCLPEFGERDCGVYFPCALQSCSGNGRCVEQGNNYTCECDTYYGGNECEMEVDCSNITLVIDESEFEGDVSEFLENFAPNLSIPLPTLKNELSGFLHYYGEDIALPPFERLTNFLKFAIRYEDEVKYMSDTVWIEGYVCLDLNADGQSLPQYIVESLGYLMDLYLSVIPDEGIISFHVNGDDKCSREPCENLGRCRSSNEFDLQCHCRSGFTGERCEIELDLCEDQPCKNGGNCTSHGGYFSCNCTEGWYGYDCGSVNETCASIFCNTGYCVEQGNNFTCICPAGLDGENCLEDVNECQDAPSPCENSGECRNYYGGYDCKCAFGWKGINCTDEINACLEGFDGDSPCLNGGSCNATGPGLFACNCTDSFSGPVCEREHVFISASLLTDHPYLPAYDNETSNITLALVETLSQNISDAIAQRGLSSKFCGVDVDPSALTRSRLGNTWFTLTICYSSDNKDYRPSVDLPYAFEDFDTLKFSDPNECNCDPCQNGGNCTSFADVYICSCPPGFIGVNCELNVCDFLTCYQGGNCTINNASLPVCECPPNTAGNNCESVVMNHTIEVSWDGDCNVTDEAIIELMRRIEKTVSGSTVTEVKSDSDVVVLNVQLLESFFTISHFKSLGRRVDVDSEAQLLWHLRTYLNTTRDGLKCRFLFNSSRGAEVCGSHVFGYLPENRCSGTIECWYFLDDEQGCDPQIAVSLLPEMAVNITSPNFPDAYGSYGFMVVRVNSPKNYFVDISFDPDRFNISRHDILVITDDDGVAQLYPGLWIDRAVLERIEYRLNALQGHVNIVFISRDNSDELRDGFSLQVTAKPFSESHYKLSTFESQLVQIPGDNGSYPNNTVSVQTFSTSEDSVLVLCTNFNKTNIDEGDRALLGIGNEPSFLRVVAAYGEDTSNPTDTQTSEIFLALDADDQTTDMSRIYRYEGTVISIPRGYDPTIDCPREEQ